MRMRNVITGPKKKGQEAITLRDSRSGELVVSASEIKRVTKLPDWRPTKHEDKLSPICPEEYYRNEGEV